MLLCAGSLIPALGGFADSEDGVSSEGLEITCASWE